MVSFSKSRWLGIIFNDFSIRTPPSGPFPPSSKSISNGPFPFPGEIARTRFIWYLSWPAGPLPPARLRPPSSHHPHCHHQHHHHHHHHHYHLIFSFATCRFLTLSTTKVSLLCRSRSLFLPQSDSFFQSRSISSSFPLPGENLELWSAGNGFCAAAISFFRRYLISGVLFRLRSMQW